MMSVFDGFKPFACMFKDVLKTVSIIVECFVSMWKQATKINSLPCQRFVLYYSLLLMHNSMCYYISWWSHWGNALLKYYSSLLKFLKKLWLNKSAILTITLHSGDKRTFRVCSMTYSWIVFFILRLIILIYITFIKSGSCNFTKSKKYGATKFTRYVKSQ